MKIKDRIYGYEEINEKVLIDLISSQPLQRLKGISQFGLPHEYYHMPSFSRYEHSVGVLILLRKLNAGLKEQIAGLIHDVSHTAFSHAIDWFIGDPLKEDYQDKIMGEFIKNSDISKILAKYGYDYKEMIDHNSFSLSEQPAPNLCADRVDYTLREIALLYNKQDAVKIFKDLKNVAGKIILVSLESADLLAKYYTSFNRNHWAGKEAKARYHILASILEKALNQKIISFEDLMKTDMDVINLLNNSNNNEILFGLKLLRNGFSLKKTKKNGVILQKKFRYIDPELIYNNKIVRLSEVLNDYKKILEKEKQHALIKEEFLIIEK